MSAAATDRLAGVRSRHLAHRLLGFALLAATTVATAATDDNQVIFPSGSGHSATAASSSGGMANVFSLVVALILAAVGGWMFWRNRRNPGGVAREGRLLAIDETRSLGNRQYLVVASYNGQKFLLGVCPGKIKLLSPLEDRGSTPSS